MARAASAAQACRTAKLIETLYTILIGLFTGFSSGMFGIGGSAVATPLLIMFLGMPALAAVTTPLLAAVPSAITGTIFYSRKKMINYRIAFLTLATAIPFGLFATYLTDIIDPNVLIIGKAFLLMLLGLKFFLTGILLKEKDVEIRESAVYTLIAGALAGSVAGILAIGGGVVFVTTFVRLHRLPMKYAVATSLFCVLIVATINSTYHVILGHVDLKVALVLCISVIPAALLGARLSSSMKNKTLELFFGSLMIALAMYFIITRF